MSSDSNCEGSDTEDVEEIEKPDPRSPIPYPCENEIDGIESLSACFCRRYSICPIFFSGSLQDACQTALFSSNIAERRPLLIYIHSNHDMQSNIFCSQIFCSEILIDYLLNNYIVWPWDITIDFNAAILRQKWNALFPLGPVPMFVNTRNTMLIGMIRPMADESHSISALDYECQVLVQDRKILRTEEDLTRETVLRELMIFKENHEKIERILEFDFIKQAKLDNEIFLKIIKYLTLNDIVKAFPRTNLSFLRDCPSVSFHVVNPSKDFTKKILQRFPSNQIISLELSYYFSLSFEFHFHLAQLNGIISLTLINFRRFGSIHSCADLFPNLTRLCLIYHDPLHFNILKEILRIEAPRIKRLEIQCNGVTCAHPTEMFSWSISIKNRTTVYLLIDLGYLSVPSSNECSENHHLCFMMSMIQFIKRFSNIQHIRFVTNKYNLELVINADQWTTVFDDCPQLKKITMDVLGGSSEQDLLLKTAMTLQNSLQNHQPTIKVQFVCL